ncbi:hypothetical protein PV433_11515 [Paenibacillus sp. GYB004]|uniref:hypothetical protein n=1 Tax=Paenibacillus sp. GYB004 TaxID=2994393 RepID=UPI002F966934
MEITIKITQDDVKMMCELAELKSVQNFVAITPTVQVSTGLVNKESDIDSIVKRIAERLSGTIREATKIDYCYRKTDEPVVGNVKIDGEKIANAIYEANDTLKQLIE